MISDVHWSEQCGGNDSHWLQQTRRLGKYLAVATTPGSVSWSSIKDIGIHQQHMIVRRVFAQWRLTAAAQVSRYPAAVEKVAARSRNADSKPLPQRSWKEKPRQVPQEKSLLHTNTHCKHRMTHACCMFLDDQVFQSVRKPEKWKTERGRKRDKKRRITVAQ